MNKEVINDNCIVKAFENNPIGILQETINNKKVYWFKAADIGNALKLSNIRVSIQNYDEDEKGVRKAYTIQGEQDTIYLSSQGVYRLLYNSKKDIAKKFRKWAGNILDDIIFNESIELKKQLHEKQELLDKKELELIRYKEYSLTYEEVEKNGHIYIISTDKLGIYKCGRTNKSVQKRVNGLQTGFVENIEILFDYKTCNEVLLEQIVHFILDRYRSNSNREHFICNLEYMKIVITKCGKLMDTLKSCYHNITEIELEEKLNKQIENENRTDIIKEINEKIFTSDNETMSKDELTNLYKKFEEIRNKFNKFTDYLEYIQIKYGKFLFDKRRNLNIINGYKIKDEYK